MKFVYSLALLSLTGCYYVPGQLFGIHKFKAGDCIVVGYVEAWSIPDYKIIAVGGHSYQTELYPYSTPGRNIQFGLDETYYGKVECK